jgi:hypothetical protein
MLKRVGIPGYYSGGNKEFLGEAWKNQGLGLALSAKDLHSKSHYKIKVFLARSLSPSRHP